VDLFALNSYSWCGDSDFVTSQYNFLVSNFSDTSVPVFFSEYGCIKPYPRVFTEVPVLYRPLMTPVLSGGMVYEYAQEVSNYGLVTINSDGSAQLIPDFDTLQSQFAKLNVTALQGLAAQNTSVVPPKCASSLITSSTFSNNFTIPAVPPGAQDLIDNGISNPPSGKIVSVTSTKVTQTVEQANGTVIQGLAIIPLSNDQINTGSPTSSSASPTSTKKNGAGSVRASHGVLIGIASVVLGLSSLL